MYARTSAGIIWTAWSEETGMAPAEVLRIVTAGGRAVAGAVGRARCAARLPALPARGREPGVRQRQVGHAGRPVDVELHHVPTLSPAC